MSLLNSDTPLHRFFLEVPEGRVRILAQGRGNVLFIREDWSALQLQEIKTVTAWHNDVLRRCTSRRWRLMHHLVAEGGVPFNHLVFDFQKAQAIDQATGEVTDLI